MTSIAHSKNIIKFITDFLSEHGSEELAEMWNEEDNMKAFTALLINAANAVKRNSSDKKIKDPLKPKGKKSAYIIFCTKKREEAKKLLNPDAKATEVTSKLGQMWNELKNSKKTADKKMLQLCEQEAAEDKARYDEDMKDYVPPSDDELIASKGKGKGKGSKKKSDPNAPKGKKSAYIFFCSDNRDAAKSEIGTDGNATDVTQLLAFQLGHSFRTALEKLFLQRGDKIFFQCVTTAFRTTGAARIARQEASALVAEIRIVVRLFSGVINHQRFRFPPPPLPFFFPHGIRISLHT
jgi:hypothetical protein